MKRDRATVLLEELLHRAADDDWPARLVQTVNVFGSYARGALNPGDVDVAVDFSRDDRWSRHLVKCLSYGRDPHAVFKQAPRGRRRGVSFLFDPHVGHEDVPMTLLCERGEPVQVGLRRLHAIAPDPLAGRAPRDAMLLASKDLTTGSPALFARNSSS